jgi:hypothetical protein
MILDSGALIEGDYRYELWRYWDFGLPAVKWIMLNPSTADASADDPTIRKCMKFARAWGFGGIKVVNLFAYRATDPKALKPLGYPKALGLDNDNHIRRVLVTPGPNIAAWGQGGKLWGRAASLKFSLATSGIKLQALKLSKDGFTPYHPLYLRDDSKPFEL